MNVLHISFFESHLSTLLKTQFYNLSDAMLENGINSEVLNIQPIEIRRRGPFDIFRKSECPKSDVGHDISSRVFVRRILVYGSKFNYFYSGIIRCVYANIATTLTLLIFNLRNYDRLYVRSYPVIFGVLFAAKLSSHRKKISVIFDTRSPFPEEGAQIGYWKNDTITFRFWKTIESIALRFSDNVIVTTDHHKSLLLKNTINIKYADKIIVIPNIGCSELVPGSMSTQEAIAYSRLVEVKKLARFIFVYAGSFLRNRWNDPGVYIDFISDIFSKTDDIYFVILTKDCDHFLNEISKQKASFDLSRLVLVSAQASNVKSFVELCDAGLTFLSTPDVRLSTKTADYLSCGIPIVCNTNAHGAFSYIKKYGCGIILDNTKDRIDYMSVINELSAAKLRARDIKFLFSKSTVVGHYISLK